MVMIGLRPIGYTFFTFIPGGVDMVHGMSEELRSVSSSFEFEVLLRIDLDQLHQFAGEMLCQVHKVF